MLSLWYFRIHFHVQFLYAGQDPPCVQPVFTIGGLFFCIDLRRHHITSFLQTARCRYTISRYQMYACRPAIFLAEPVRGAIPNTIIGTCIGHVCRSFMNVISMCLPMFNYGDHPCNLFSPTVIISSSSPSSGVHISRPEWFSPSVQGTPALRYLIIPKEKITRIVEPLDRSWFSLWRKKTWREFFS